MIDLDKIDPLGIVADFRNVNNTILNIGCTDDYILQNPHGRKLQPHIFFFHFRELCTFLAVQIYIYLVLAGKSQKFWLTMKTNASWSYYTSRILLARRWYIIGIFKKLSQRLNGKEEKNVKTPK